MFIQAVFYILLFLAFLWCLWKFVVKDLLESHNIETEEVETNYTKRLEKTEVEHKRTKVSAEAIEKEVGLRKEMSDLDTKIEDAEEELKGL